jgi:hypothetical protein
MSARVAALLVFRARRARSLGSAGAARLRPALAAHLGSGPGIHRRRARGRDVPIRE